MMKVTGGEDLTEDLEEMRKRVDAVQTAIEQYGSAENALEEIRKSLSLRSIPKNVPLMSKEDAEEVIQDQRMMDVQYLIMDLEEMISGA